LFQDSFNRADGAPGNDWNVESGTWDILTNELRCHTGNAVIERVVPVGGQTDSDIQLTSGVGFNWGVLSYYYLFQRANDARSAALRWRIKNGGIGGANIQLSKVVGGSATVIAEVGTIDLSSGPHTLSFRAMGTLIVASIDGAIVLAVNDASIASGSYMAMSCVAADSVFWTDVSIYTPTQAGLVASPPQLVPALDGQHVYLSAIGLNWTPGTPGQPTFTADVGSITSQQVVSPTAAILTYSPPDTAAQVKFTDPDSGQFAVVYVTGGSLTAPALGSAPGNVLDWLWDTGNSILTLIEQWAGTAWGVLVVALVNAWKPAGLVAGSIPFSLTNLMVSTLPCVANTRR
jgi:hypothetical protein